MTIVRVKMVVRDNVVTANFLSNERRKKPIKLPLWHDRQCLRTLIKDLDLLQVFGCRRENPMQRDDYMVSSVQKLVTFYI